MRPVASLPRPEPGKYRVAYDDADAGYPSVGEVEVPPTDSAALERDVRAGLPLGSSLAAVEAFLARRGLEFSFDASSRTVQAIARNLKGSDWLVSQSLQLRFHFDDASGLKSIEAEPVATGP